MEERVKQLIKEAREIEKTLLKLKLVTRLRKRPNWTLDEILKILDAL